MSTLELYLGAIRGLLPHRNRDDILAELRAAVGERREEREAELGRALTDAEQEQLLQEFGHPISVAARYRGTTHLIGPNYYPIFLFILQRMLWVIALGSLVLGWAIRVAFGAPIGPALLSASGTTVTVMLAFVGAITIAFGALERFVPASEFLCRWRASQLKSPTLKRPYARLGDGLAGLGNLLLALWWFSSAPPHTLLPPSWTGGVHIAWGAFYSTYGLPMLAIFVLQSIIHGAAALGLLSERVAAYMRSTMLVAAATLALVIVRVDGALLTAQGPTEGAPLTPIFSLGFRLALLLSAIGATVQAVIGYWRIGRRGTESPDVSTQGENRNARAE